MRLSALELRDFRNYSSFSLSNLDNLTIFVGNNGVGKTNLLEAISFLTAGTSFRAGQISQVVREGTPSARLTAELTDGNRALSVALSLEAGKKRFSVNGKAKAQVDVRGILPAVTFTPDDLELVKKASGVKRDALDGLGSQLARNYYIVRRDFEKAVRYKNRMFRDEASLVLIESLNETLIACGAQLFCFRKALFDRLVPLVARNYDLISRESGAFTARYVPSWERFGEPEQALAVGEQLSREEVRELLSANLTRHFAEERRRGRALVGPHADAVGFELGGRDVALFASQGQQRSVVLAWKLAEVEVTRQILGVSPVLLLDDVMSELDGSRREMLMRFATDEIQTFVTTTDLTGFPPELRTRANVVNLAP